MINYFLAKKLDVYITTLDASSAFDRINVYGLLTKLLNRNVSFDLIRVFLSWYTCSLACVRVLGECTTFINIHSDVKQGGILSPIFSNIYVDDQMKLLMKVNLE